MSQSYITVNQNETRAIELLIRDQNDDPVYPDSAYARVVDAYTDIPVVSEMVAMVDGNKIYFLLTPVVTAEPGMYDVIWRIVKTETSIYTFYHKTRVTVNEL
ncbi:MAG TPA: hypothetical protein P5293_06130 [Bacteroidales bacterium]|nr:hypothetical protein [Bacteroidales bacterium]